MEINAFLVLSAVIVGAIIWGISGMVLFVPFLGIAKALVESNPEWTKYAILFASADPDPAQKTAFKKLQEKISEKKTNRKNRLQS